MDYLGIKINKPKVAFFDFTCCEGCQLQVANREETLLDFFSLIEVVNFREISSEKRDDYEIAFVEGSVSRDDQLERLRGIRERAKIVVALGTCAIYGGVNKIANRSPVADNMREVYGDRTYPSLPVRALAEVVRVDFSVPGCPINKREFENIVLHLALGLEFRFKKYPVCVECKRNMNHCLLDEKQICLGAVTLAGCNAPCPGGKTPCYGCRGPAPDANWKSLSRILTGRGFSAEEIQEKLSFFNALDEVVR